MEKLTPDYKTLYKDILLKKCPKKLIDCEKKLKKETLSVMDIIEINRKIFGTDADSISVNQRHCSYSKSDILKILDYQKKHKLNNSQLAAHFKLSRNTVAKWRKMFLL